MQVGLAAFIQGWRWVPGACLTCCRACLSSPMRQAGLGRGTRHLLCRGAPAGRAQQSLQAGWSQSERGTRSLCCLSSQVVFDSEGEDGPLPVASVARVILVQKPLGQGCGYRTRGRAEGRRAPFPPFCLRKAAPLSGRTVSCQLEKPVCPPRRRMPRPAHGEWPVGRLCLGFIRSANIY